MDFPPKFVEIFFGFICQGGTIMFRKGLVRIWFYTYSMLIQAKNYMHILISHRYVCQYRFHDQRSLRQDYWHSIMVATVSCFARGTEGSGTSADFFVSGDVLARPIDASPGRFSSISVEHFTIPNPTGGFHNGSVHRISWSRVPEQSTVRLNSSTMREYPAHES